MATDWELSRYLCEHYAYELKMLRYSLGQLSKIPTSEAEQLRWNAMLESCAVHARTLRDFFESRPPKDPKRPPEDRQATEYGSPAATVGDLKDDFTAINKQVAHLDINRPFGRDEAKLTAERLVKVSAWVEEQHATFMAAAKPERVAGWDDSLASVSEATSGTTPTATKTIATTSIATSVSAGFAGSQRAEKNE